MIERGGKLNIYRCWMKVRVYTVIMALVCFLVPALRYVGIRYDSVFYITYAINSAVLSICCLILNIKNGFVWYYPIVALFFLAAALVTYFINEVPTLIPNMVINYMFIGYITSIIGAIVHKIRKNNYED